VNLDNGAVPPAPTVAATARRAEEGRDRARSHPGRHHRIRKDPAHVGIDKDYPHRRHMQTLVRSLSLTESQLMDEAVRRRSRFYRGREIELADDQPWILPSSGVTDRLGRSAARTLVPETCELAGRVVFPFLEALERGHRVLRVSTPSAP
jgi:hypothetical protein